MSLRWRLTGALNLLVLTGVLSTTIAHILEVRQRLETSLTEQARRLAGSIRTELRQTSLVLDKELERALTPGYLDRWLGPTGRARFVGIEERLQPGRLEILKVLAPDGAILASAHWPASFGALDANRDLYPSPPGESARLVIEATQQGSVPSLQRWTAARWGGRDVLIVTGRFFGDESLEDIRAIVGADLLGLCFVNPESGRRCNVVSATRPETPIPFDPEHEDWVERFQLASVDLTPSGDDFTSAVVGLDRAPADEVQLAILIRALLVGFLSLVIAFILGFFLAGRIVRPVEALAQAAQRIAGGDFEARVTLERQQGGREVRGLVAAFNTMAEEIARSHERARRAERVAAWREIARGLAHEVKNPLTPILGAIDIIRRARRLKRDDFDDILHEQAEAVVEEVMRLKELSDAFARFARLPEPSPERLDLSRVLDKAAALYAGESSLDVVRHYDDDVPEVLADRTQMATAVTNLVKNAVEAMDGAGRLTLSVRRAQLRGLPAVEMVVEDAGPGIAAEMRDRLFTPYVTTKGSRGTGLGLALVHRIISEHAGEVEVGTGRDGGAAFIIRVPVDSAQKETNA